MKSRLVKISVLLALTLMATVAANATVLVSDLGVFGSPNDVYERQFTYNPATMGTQLIIQTFGYGGTGNMPGGTNASGIVIASGGFDPIIALYNGAVGGGGALVNGNALDDDHPSSPYGATPCGPGSGVASPSCYDSRLVFNNLPAGTYTLAMSVFNNFPGANENSPYAGGLVDFGSRTNHYAVDVVAIPEPVTAVLVGSGLLALGYALRRRQRS